MANILRAKKTLKKVWKKSEKIHRVLCWSNKHVDKFSRNFNILLQVYWTSLVGGQFSQSGFPKSFFSQKFFFPKNMFSQSIFSQEKVFPKCYLTYIFTFGLVDLPSRVLKWWYFLSKIQEWMTKEIFFFLKLKVTKSLNSWCMFRIHLELFVRSKKSVFSLTSRFLVLHVFWFDMF